MLYAQCRQYLIDKLKEAGVKTRIYTTQKLLEKCMESHVGAVLFQSETYSRNGSKTYFKDEEGARHKRRKLFDRDLTFSAIIGEYSDDAAEALFEKFIGLLDAGIYVDGSYVPIELADADWVDEEDSVLRAKVAVELTVVFHGGVYRDTGMAPVTGVQVVGVSKENGKETADGSES